MRTFKSVALAFALLAAPAAFAATGTAIECPREKCTKEEAAKCDPKLCPKEACTPEEKARCARSANAKQKPAAPAPKTDKS